MITESELPTFITKSMKKWLTQYFENGFSKITKLGVFHWEFRPNKRLPEKPRRMPRIDDWIELKSSSVNHSIYFHEVGLETLHVYEISGLTLAGYKVAYEYTWDGKEFLRGKKLFSMIS